jgi:ribosomal protein S6--L-glutamate ligase
VKVTFLLERGSPPRMNPIFAETRELLKSRGVDVDLRFPEYELTRVDELTVDSDLYVLKSNTSLSFALASVLHYLGAPLLNRYGACLATRDKVVTAAVLAAAGVPTPRSLLAAQPVQLSSHLAAGPLILKPHRGAYGRGVAVADSVANLPAAENFPELVFAQEYLAWARTDLKVFAIGDDLFGVRKPFSDTSYLSGGEQAKLTPHVEAIVRRVGDALGLELYGVDLAEDESGLRVFDVNTVPGYRGVPDAARRLATYIEGKARNA